MCMCVCVCMYVILRTSNSAREYRVIVPGLGRDLSRDQVGTHWVGHDLSLVPEETPQEH